MPKHDDLTKQSRTGRRQLYCSFQPPESVRQLLEQRCEVRFASGKGPIAHQIGDAEAAMVVVTDDLSAPVIIDLPASLRAIATYSVGYEHIDVAAATARGIAVLTTPDVLSPAVAENALFLLLGVARRATESIELVRSGRWSGWTPTQLIGFELRGKTLGILGMGRIGGEVARRASALGMTVCYHNRHPATAPNARTYRFEPDLYEFLGSLDVLLLAAPSTDETRGIINSDTLAQLKPGASLINIGRGDLVVDDAVISALQSRHLRGAGLDVFNNEPALDPRYLELPNVFALPHIGSSTIEARTSMAEILLDGLDAIDRGERPANQIG